MMAAIRAGAHGYLLKDSEPHQILRHIKDAIRGETPISGRAVTHMMEAIRHQNNATETSKPSELSARESEILTLFAKGLSYRETSEILKISQHTVSAHAKSVYSKLEVNSRNEAVFEALKLGWITLKFSRFRDVCYLLCPRQIDDNTVTCTVNAHHRS